MTDRYADLMELAAAAGREPLWWDNHGVPRFCEPPMPRHLMGRIRCQRCEREFLVSLTDNIYHNRHGIRDAEGRLIYGPPCVEQDPEKAAELTEDLGFGISRIRPETWNRYAAGEHLRLTADWHYGDPPAHGCVGDSMNSIPEHEWDEFFEENGDA